ncbi:hypothetical protein Ancab_039211 [Ancistrocladus abbreviatus]
MDNLSENALRKALSEKQAAVDAQANAVREVKASGAAKDAVDAAVQALNALKLEKSAVEKQLRSMVSSNGSGDTSSMNREAFRQSVINTLERRLFYIPSFKIYRGVAGLYDYGPPGCAVKSNVLAFWRQHFVLEENMLEVDCPCVTPEIVLKASGHVDKFTDLMVKDEKTGTYYRADHLLKDFCKEKLEKDLSLSAEKAAELRHVLAVLDDLSSEELGAKIKEYGIAAPETKNPLSDPYPFNLMFQTSIGPSGLSPGYMRPETAQGIFVNFKDLYYFNGNKLPFAAAQIGQAFRNEISPRQGLLRVREFTLAEIEHFVDPEDKSHPKFVEVANLEFFDVSKGASGFWTFSTKDSPRGLSTMKHWAISSGGVYIFLTSLGIDKERLRFRQHLANEMAHYAADCWDAEIECSHGWIECVGIADRSAYDLRAHSREVGNECNAFKWFLKYTGKKVGVPLVAYEKFAEPREVEKLVIAPVKKELGLAFKGNQKMIIEALAAMGEKEAMEMKANLESKGEVEFYVCALGKNVAINKNMVTISKDIKKEHQRNQQYEEVAKQIAKSLTAAGISCKIDITGRGLPGLPCAGLFVAACNFHGFYDVSVMQEQMNLGVPLAITVDSTTSVTIRERDSKEQIRVNVDEVASVVKEVTDGQSTWADVLLEIPDPFININR